VSACECGRPEKRPEKPVGAVSIQMITVYI
jgi:hypothetical protein